MITQKTINEVHELPIEKVIGKEIDLHKKGADYKAKCPFHKDSDPSLSISTSKNVYKCFSCGEGGSGGVSFVMAHHNLDYYAAVQYICEIHGLTFEVDKDTKQPTPEERDKYKYQERLLADTQKRYTQALTEQQLQAFAKQRSIPPDILQDFDLGYAAGGNLIRKELIKIGHLQDGIDCGILQNGDKASYDTYQDRITFPIHDPRGRLLTWGGRTTVDHPAKYLNGPDSWIYDKSKILYNLHRAAKAIKEDNRTAYLCEGYMDVISCAAAGIQNAVASCGTALTPSQAKQLKRYADKVVLWYDGDEAGMTATLKAIPILLQAGLKVAVLNVVGHDPDDYRKHRQWTLDTADANKQQLKAQQVHGLDWIYDYLLSPIKVYKLNDTKKVQAIRDKYKKLGVWIDLEEYWLWKTSLNVVNLVGEAGKYTVEPEERNIDEEMELRDKFLKYVKLYNSFVQEEWTMKLAKRWRYAKKKIADAITHSESIRPKQEVVHAPEDIEHLPKGCDKEFYLRYGFAPSEDNTGYYFQTQNGSFQKVGNFVLKPLFHIYGQDNKRYIEVSNKYKNSRILIDSRDMASVDRLHATLFDEGGFVAGTISKHQYMQLLEYWGNQFPKCYELTSLGYQSEGFFAFSNMVYNGKLSEFDSLGIYNHKDTNFLSPSVVENLLDIRDNERTTEYDDFLTYTQSTVSLPDYFQLYADVFQDHAVYGLGFILMSVFRDIAIRSNNIPHLYAHGPTSSGKSKFAETTMHFFYAGKNSENKKMAPYQLANGTEASLFAYMQRTANVLVVYNEVDTKSASEDRILLFKGVYDGEGRSKMNGVKRNIITQHARCCITLVGQFMYTGDDGSVVNRSIPCKFNQRNEDNTFTQEETDRFLELERITDQGVSSLVCDLLAHRDRVDERYADTYNKCAKRLRKNTHGINSRLIDNYAHILTLYALLESEIKLPFTSKYVYEKILVDMEEQNELVQDNGVVNQFWSVVDFMLQFNEVHADNEIALEGRMDLTVIGRNKPEVVTFTKVRNIVFVNMSMMHMKYEINSRKRGAAVMPKTNLEKYIKDHPAYIGTVKHHNFKEAKRTSAFAFYADKLPVDLTEQLTAGAAAEPTEPATERVAGYVCGEPKLEVKAGEELLYVPLERKIAMGKYQKYKLITSQTERIAEFTAQAEVDASGYVESGKFQNEGHTIEWMRLLATDIHSIAASELTAAVQDNPAEPTEESNLPF